MQGSPDYTHSSNKLVQISVFHVLVLSKIKNGLFLILCLDKKNLSISLAHFCEI